MNRRTALALLSLALTAPAFGQNNAQNQPQPPNRRPPERVIVPIDDFDKIFDREKGGVFVPYEELLRLLDRAQARPVQPPQTPAAPPAEYVLVSAQLKGVAGERVVQFEATFDIEVLESDRWVIVPIGLAEASLEDVRAGQTRAVVGPMAQLAQRVQPAPGQPAREPLPTTGYGVILRGAGRVTTTARFAVPIASRPGESTFQLSFPAAALSSFEVTLPQSGLRVNIAGSLATEEVSDPRADQTKVRAYFGAAARAGVTWNPRPKEVEGEALPTLLFADTETAVRLDEGVLQATTRVKYRINQAPCREFRVQFPRGYTLLGVRAANMSAIPTAEPAGDAQQITVRLHEPAKEEYVLELDLEKIVPDGTATLELPRITTVGTEREAGVVAVRGTQYLTLEPAALQGVSQVDAGSTTNVSEALARDLRWERARDPRPPLAFRYLRQPYALNVKVGRVEPEVEGRTRTLVMVKDEELALAMTVDYTVRKRGIFGVRMRLPQGFVVQPDTFDDAVKDHRVTPDPQGDILTVEFVNQRQDRFPLTVAGTLRRAGGEGEKLALPRIRLLDVVKESGLVAVGSQTHLQLTLEGQAAGLVPRGIPELRGELGFAPNQGEDITFGYTFVHAARDAVAATFAVKKREPKVTARVESFVDAQEDQVKVENAINYLVEYAAVEQVRIRVPAELDTEEELKIEGEGLVQDRRCEVGPDGAVWTIALQGKRTGAFTVRVKYDVKLDDFKAGQQKDVTLHELTVLDCFTETGDIALVKHENLVITDQDRLGVERRDQRELPEALRARGAIQAFRYVSHPYRLTLRITKYDFQAPLGILVKHLHHDEVVSLEGPVKCEAWLLVQNNAEQFLTIALPPGAQMRDLLVHGKQQEWSVMPNVTPTTIQVQLGEHRSGADGGAFSIRLRYDVPNESLGGLSGLELHTLRFPLGEDRHVPVARLTRALYLPTERAYLEFDTDATKHFDDSTLWEDLKQAVGVRVDRIVGGSGKAAALQAIADLKDPSVSPQDSSNRYSALELPSTEGVRLFEKLDNPARLTVRFASWPVFFLLDVLALVAVVALGGLLEARRVTSGMAYVALASAAAILGATFLGKAWEPFFASGLVGAVGLGGFFLLRGAWRELTVERHARRMEELAQEAAVAKQRAQAAEAEARVKASAPAPASSVPLSITPRDPKTAPPRPDDAAAADAIRLDDPHTPPQA